MEERNEDSHFSFACLTAFAGIYYSSLLQIPIWNSCNLQRQSAYLFLLLMMSGYYYYFSYSSLIWGKASITKVHIFSTSTLFRNMKKKSKGPVLNILPQLALPFFSPLFHELLGGNVPAQTDSQAQLITIISQFEKGIVFILQARNRKGQSWSEIFNSNSLCQEVRSFSNKWQAKPSQMNLSLLGCVIKGQIVWTKGGSLKVFRFQHFCLLVLPCLERDYPGVTSWLGGQHQFPHKNIQQ